MKIILSVILVSTVCSKQYCKLDCSGKLFRINHLRLLRGKWCADCLMIDGLVAQCGARLVDLWKRDEGGTGQYPPPTLHVSVW